MRCFLFFMVVLCCSITTGLATDIHVPADYPTIQQAINHALDGDTILVAPGTYYENLEVVDKRPTIRSELGYSDTILDGMQSGSVLFIDNGVGIDTIIDGFTIRNGSGTLDSNEYYGGGIYCYDSSPTITNCHITNSSVNRGGGVACVGPYCNIVLRSCSISDNEAVVMGGGIYSESTNMVIEECAIENNNCNGFGGGVCAVDHYNSSQPLIIGSTFRSNFGRDRGGAINCDAATQPCIKYNLFEYNMSQNGGAIFFYDGHIDNNKIINNYGDTIPPNTDHVGVGAGILSGGINPIIENNYIANNTAMSSGGGIMYNAYAGIIRNNIIVGNIANGSTFAGEKLYGGGIAIPYEFSSSSTIISDCIIADNYAYDMGGGIYIGDLLEIGSKATLINCTVTNNDSTLGSGIYCESLAQLEVYNSIVYNNLHGQIYYAGLKPTVKYSCIKGDYPGNGNIDSDPVFVDPAKSDYHLTYLSPCLDAGDDTVANLPLIDYEGDPRIALGTVDMGADEFHPHLYYIGDALPSNNIQIKIVGLPSTTQVGLFLGPGALPSPIPSCFGDWFLDFPVSLIRYSGYIPPDGILEFTAKIPAYPHDAYYLQALIGDDLSNLCTVEVE